MIAHARTHACTQHTHMHTHTHAHAHTHTQVLLSTGERAELGTEEYLPLSPVLEGMVILKKNPDYVE